MAPKRKIILSGELAKRYGRVHDLAVNSPAEAIRALCSQHPSLHNFLISSEDRNVGYRVLIDDDQLDEVSRLPLPFSKTMHIVPVIGGAKNGVLGVVLGAALIVASFYLPVTPLIAGLGSFAPSFASIAFGIGTSMLLGGVSGLLAGTPKTNSSISQQPTNLPSYTFNGAVNTTAQGNPVPVGYGRMIIGSAVVSAGITADDYQASGME